MNNNCGDINQILKNPKTNKIQLKLKRQKEERPSIVSQPPIPPQTITTQTEQNLPPISEEQNLPHISEEQKNIVDLIGQGCNISVDAVAGSGKTTTGLYIAINNPTKHILLLTYNAKLKIETREKVQLLNLHNMEIHSYHSFCVKYFYRKAYTDSGIIAFLKLNNHSAILRSFEYEIMIVDEAQDMNPVYYEVVQHILKRLKKIEVEPQLIVMGDQKQSIYAFNNADSRFLTLSTQIFNNRYQWKKGTLSTSYRLTNQMTRFINGCCNGALPIQAIKPGPRVRYLICDTFGSKPYREIKNYLRHGYRNQDIFILTPSVRSENSPVRRLANKLTNDNIAIYVPNSDEEKLDDDILNGKIVFSTFHQVKGLERPIVIVFNFDNSYFKFYAKDIPPYEYTQIANTLYVAITRAREQLVVLHDEKYNYLDFLRQSQLYDNCELEISHEFRPQNEKLSRRSRLKEIKVTELVKYVPVEILDQCMNYLTIDSSMGEHDLLEIPTKIKEKDLYESVSEITGSAIPSYYEYKISGKMTVYDYLRNNKMNEIEIYLGGKKCLLSDDNSDDDEVRLYDKLYANLSTTQDVGWSILQLTTHWLCEKTGYDFKKKQIKQYNWLSPEILEQANNRLDLIFPPETHPYLQFEKSLIIPYDSYMIVGFADVYNTLTRNLWELKTVKEVENIHFLQVAIYCWMINLSEPNDQVQQVNVFNIMNSVRYTIQAEMSQLENVVKILIEHKQNRQFKKSNQEFIEKCRKISEKFNN